MLERVTLWRGCQVQGWGWGAPRLLRPRHRDLCTSPAPLTWPLRVTQSGKRCPYLGADPVLRRAGKLRGPGGYTALAAQPRPPVPARAGRARSQARLEKGRWLRVTSGPGGGQTDFPGVISHLQGFS